MSISCYDNYLQSVADSGKDPISVENTVSRIEAGFMTDKNWEDRATGLLFGHVQSGKTTQTMGVLSRAIDLGAHVVVYLTTDNTALYDQTVADIYKTASGRGAQVLKEPDDGMLPFCASSVVIVLKKNESVLTRWVSALKSLDNLRDIFIIDDEADAASLDTKQNSATQVSAIHERLCALKNLGGGSLYLQVTGTPQANLILPVDDPMRPSFWTTFEPGSSYIGGNEVYLNPDCIASIAESEGAMIKNGQIPSGLRDAFIYFCVVASILIKEEKYARMLVHPSHLTSVHASAFNSLSDLRDELISEILEAKKEHKFPASIIEVLSRRANFRHISIDPDVILEVLQAMEISILNAGSSAVAIFDNKGDPLNKIQVFIGGNILGRGLRIPQLQTMYYARTAKKPQFDTMWQQNRIFGYDRDIDLLKIFVDDKTLAQFVSMAESNAMLFELINSQPISDVSLQMVGSLVPTRKNVIPVNKYLVLVGGKHYFTRNIERYVQDTAHLDKKLSKYPVKGYSKVSAEEAVKLLACIQGDDMLDLARFAILSSNKDVYISVNPNKHLKDDYRAVLSESEYKASDSVAPDSFVITFCLLSASTQRPSKLWIGDVRAPDGNIYSRTPD